jgi:hypothetical protein
VSISPQSHHAKAYVFSSPNNYNASLPKESCARVATCCTIRCFQCRRLLRSCGVLDGPTDSGNNCNVSLPREGCARAIACCTICPSRCRRLFHSYGVSNGMAEFVHCLARRSLRRRL